MNFSYYNLFVYLVCFHILGIFLKGQGSFLKLDFYQYYPSLIGEMFSVFNVLLTQDANWDIFLSLQRFVFINKMRMEVTASARQMSLMGFWGIFFGLQLS